MSFIDIGFVVVLTLGTISLIIIIALMIYVCRGDSCADSEI